MFLNSQCHLVIGSYLIQRFVQHEFHNQVVYPKKMKEIEPSLQEWYA
jgi:hypothetical protein